jgi:hypothetical protein
MHVQHLKLQVVLAPATEHCRRSNGPWNTVLIAGTNSAGLHAGINVGRASKLFRESSLLHHQSAKATVAAAAGQHPKLLGHMHLSAATRQS